MAESTTENLFREFYGASTFIEKRAAYERSGLSVGSISKATGMSTTAIHIAMNGFRYRSGEPVVISPPDSTVVKLTSVLRVDPAALRDAGRTRAAELLAEALGADLSTSALTDQTAQALAAGRHALAREVLAVFSTEELRAEIARRQQQDDASDDEQTYQELADDLKTGQFPG